MSLVSPLIISFFSSLSSLSYLLFLLFFPVASFPPSAPLSSLPLFLPCPPLHTTHTFVWTTLQRQTVLQEFISVPNSPHFFFFLNTKCFSLQTADAVIMLAQTAWSPHQVEERGRRDDNVLCGSVGVCVYM